jgi:hypothetical protein
MEIAGLRANPQLMPGRGRRHFYHTGVATR